MASLNPCQLVPNTLFPIIDHKLSPDVSEESICYFPSFCTVVLLLHVRGTVTLGFHLYPDQNLNFSLTSCASVLHKDHLLVWQ